MPQSAIATVPPGRWAVGVSGGADSVALLALLRTREDLRLHVVHLDHQTRGAESAADAEFVRNLADKWGLPVTLALRRQVQCGLGSVPANPSAGYRAVRISLFGRVVTEQQCQGVLLAHHADDQAETVLHRLIRGSGPAGLAGMAPRTMLGDLCVLRPLLKVRRQALREHLHSVRQEWREDSSNQSPQYLRNRLRKLLGGRPELHDLLILVGERCRSFRSWLEDSAPLLSSDFSAQEIAVLPCLVASESVRRWLVMQGSPAADLSREVLGRLLTMASDAGSAPRVCFPGDVLVRRRGGRISAASKGKQPTSPPAGTTRRT